MRKITACGLLSLALASCSSLRIEHVDYGWPVEFVSAASQSNMVTADRYGLSFSVQDSSALAGSQIRLLRSNEGFYFLTGPRFKHVYVFRCDEHALVKESVIEVSQTGLRDPRLNLRAPFVELLDGEGFHKLLTRSEIQEGSNP